ncbi:hypothetical protein ACHHYP_08636 [Achlya hypogyna]|uniref:Uncharacterized protein n=1 Tax=Achlya hypogyna TaxID=1202772 RepID=A0A1V9ZL20_ACHHY|nr:hypothetical protein ACHHYP_08636 [Achlya hypogyna]
MQRRYRALEKLKTLVAAGTLPVSDASHRALQIVETTPQPVRLQDPRLTAISTELLAQAASDPQKAKQIANLRGRLDRLRDEDSRVQKALTQTDLLEETPKANALLDVVEFSYLYALFDQFKYLDAFEQLAAVPAATWQRTPHTTLQQLLKSATTVMGHAAMPAQDKMAAASPSAMHLHFLRFIRTLHDAKALPPNWITLPSAILAMKMASVQAKDASYLLHLSAAQSAAYADSLTIRYALAQRDLTEPTVVAPPPALFVATIQVLDYLDLHAALPGVHQAYRGPLSPEVLDALLRVLVQPRLARPAARALAVSLTLDLVPYLERGCERALLDALLRAGLPDDAYDALLKMHALSPGLRLPGALQTELLVAFYKRRQLDQFHLAFDEMWARGYIVGPREFRRLTAVVPPHVLQSLMGSRDYRGCLTELLAAARVKSPDALDLRAQPAALAPALVQLALDALRPSAVDAADLVVLVSQPAATAAIKALLAAKGLPCTSPVRGRLVVAADALQEYLEDKDTQRVKDSVWRLMVLRAAGVSSVVAGAVAYWSAMH